MNILGVDVYDFPLYYRRLKLFSFFTYQRLVFHVIMSFQSLTKHDRSIDSIDMKSCNHEKLENISSFYLVIYFNFQTSFNKLIQ